LDAPHLVVVRHQGYAREGQVQQDEEVVAAVDLPCRAASAARWTSLWCATGRQRLQHGGSPSRSSPDPLLQSAIQYKCSLPSGMRRMAGTRVALASPGACSDAWLACASPLGTRASGAHHGVGRVDALHLGESVDLDSPPIRHRSDTSDCTSKVVCLMPPCTFRASRHERSHCLATQQVLTVTVPGRQHGAAVRQGRPADN